MEQMFSEEVIDKLNFYVYRLIDPRNGETFYVGKGKGNRVFSHARAELTSKDDELSSKLKRIYEIQSSGFEVAHIIHRHGMDESTAIQVEAALIDAYPGLANDMSGHGSSEFGVMHAKEIITQYQSAVAEFEHKAIIITVNRSAEERGIYSATRYAWRLSKSKAEKAEIIVASVRGIIRGVFIAEKWLPARPENFPEFGSETRKGRFGFIGKKASKEIHDLYFNKRIPDKYRKRGAANPIKYTW